MKLLPDDKPLDYTLMWKCHKCEKWNSETADTCNKCSTPMPLQPQDTLPKQRVVRMLDTLIAYCEDNGLNMCLTSIFRAVVVALETQTEGQLAQLCHMFISLHLYYRKDGDRLWTFKNRWKTR